MATKKNKHFIDIQNISLEIESFISKTGLELAKTFGVKLHSDESFNDKDLVAAMKKNKKKIMADETLFYMYRSYYAAVRMFDAGQGKAVPADKLLTK